MEYIASLSYGKDSIVIPELCMKCGLPLNRIVPADRTFRWSMLEGEKENLSW